MDGFLIDAFYKDVTGHVVFILKKGPNTISKKYAAYTYIVRNRTVSKQC